MKLWILTTFYAVSLLLLSGCATKPRPSDKATIDSTLPVVALTENGVVVDMSSIAFEWQSIKDYRVEGIYIYRQNMKRGDSTQEYYDTIDNRFATHYVDNKIDPDTKYSYSFKTYSGKAESLKSTPTLVSSLPVLKSVSWIHSIQEMPKSAKVLWKPHDNKIVKAYIIERRTLEDSDWNKIATVEGRFNAEYIDTKLKDSQVYKYRIRVLTHDGLISEPSTEVTSITKALPKGISDIIATRDLPKKIKVSWIPVSDAKDFSGYKVYRAEKINGNFEALKATTATEFVDSINEDGKNYFYRVSVVDKDGLESDTKNQAIQGQTLSKTTAPSITEAKIEANKVVISWVSTDANVKSYIVTKKQKNSWFGASSEEFTGINGNTFVDTAIEPETSYIYHVYGIDNNAIRSQPSIEVNFTTTKTQGKVIKKSSKKQSTKKASGSSSAPSEADGKNEEVIQPMQDMIEI